MFVAVENILLINRAVMFEVCYSRAQFTTCTCCTCSPPKRCRMSFLGFNVLFHLCISIDIDECIEYPTICGPNCNCTNSIGSYNCSCFSGYRLNNPDVIASITNPCTGAYSLLCYRCHIHCNAWMNI